MTNSEPLLGKHALIMGATGELAQGIAVMLATAGADVALTTASNDAEEAFALRRVSRAVRNLGRQSMNESVDMSIGTGVQIAVRQVAKELGGIDILVVACDLRIDKVSEKLTDADWSRVLNTNLSSVYYACRAAYREMQETGGDIVVLTPALPTGAAQAAAVAGVEALVASLTEEWAAAGIRVAGLKLGDVRLAVGEVARVLKTVG